MITLISDNFESGTGNWNTIGDVSLIDTSRGKSVQLNLLPEIDAAISQNIPIDNNDLSIKLALNTTLSVIGDSRYLVDVSGNGIDNSNYPFELLCIRNSFISECSLLSTSPSSTGETIPVSLGGSESFRIPLNLEDFAVNGWVELNLIITNYDINYKMGTLFVNNNLVISGLMYQYNGLFDFGISVSGQPTILNSQARAVIDDVLVEILEACPSTLKYSGDTVTLQATPTDGTGPYNVEFQKNGFQINELRLDGSNPIYPATENERITRIYTLDDADIVGASEGKITFSVSILDSCPTGAKSCTETCDVYIGCISPVCNFNVT